MASSHPADCEAQLLIEGKKAHLLESIRQLNQERNQYSFVSKLPPEMLGNIFVHASSGSNSAYPASRFSFSFVSRHWRNVARSTPRVWGALFENNLNWSRLMLDLSKTTDLDIEFTCLNYWRSKESMSRKVEFLTEILTEHATRIKRLIIRSSLTSSIPLPTTSPRLLHLCLTFEPGVDPKPHLSAQTFSDSPLTELILKGCSVDWKSLTFTDLKTLQLKNVTSPEAVTLLDFVEALQKMNRLELLDLSHSIPAANEEYPVARPAILLSLQKLVIQENTIATANLIRWLKTSTSATLAIEARSNNAVNDCTTFGQSLSIFFSGMNGPGIHGMPSYDTLSLSGNSHNAFIRAWLKPVAYRGFTQTRSDEPQVILHMNGFAPALSHVIAGLPLDGLKTLSLRPDFEEQVPASFLRETFGNLPELETIFSSRHSSNELFDALRYNPGPESAFQLSFPQLKNISLKDIIFRKMSKLNDISISLESFKDCIRSRRERGAPIQKLSISDACYLFKKNIPPLEKIVDELEWDGRQLRIDRR